MHKTVSGPCSTAQGQSAGVLPNLPQEGEISLGVTTPLRKGEDQCSIAGLVSPP